MTIACTVLGLIRIFVTDPEQTNNFGFGRIQIRKTSTIPNIPVPKHTGNFSRKKCSPTVFLVAKIVNISSNSLT